jgi:glutamine amidotransferase
VNVHLVDYGSGNLLSVRRAMEHCGADVTVSGDPKALVAAERLVLPGVGAFGDCMMGMEARHLIEPLKAFAVTGRPFMGICVGMQALMDSGEEFGDHVGIGMIPGTVGAIPATDANGDAHKVPHIGWAPLVLPEGAPASRWRGSLLDGVALEETAYFVHSYTAIPQNASHRLADAWYNGCLIAAAISEENVTGLQFHPEKSGEVGLKVIRNFLKF